MPLVTGKISWRANSSNKTYAGLLTALRNFIVNSGNYTLVTDQITASSYFVVKSVRNTGFAGDTIIARVRVATYVGGRLAGQPCILFEAAEAWTGTTGTNVFPQNGVSYPSGSEPSSCAGTPFSLAHDTDIWVSCDDTFLLSMSRNYHGEIACISSAPNGVVGIERIAGDNDPGSFYANITELAYTTGSFFVYPPKRFDGVAGYPNGPYIAETSIGRINNSNGIGLPGPDEAGNHVIFEFRASLPSMNRLKGRLLGVAVSTWGNDLALGQLLPNPTSPQYIVGKCLEQSILMRVANTITPITT